MMLLVVYCLVFTFRLRLVCSLGAIGFWLLRLRRHDTTQDQQPTAGARAGHHHNPGENFGASRCDRSIGYVRACVWMC